MAIPKTKDGGECSVCHDRPGRIGLQGEDGLLCARCLLFSVDVLPARLAWSVTVLRRPGQLPTFGAKIRWFYWRHVRRYDYEVCHRCGRPVGHFTGSWWHADDWLWSHVGGDHFGVLCPPCFTAIADSEGHPIRWIAKAYVA